jgi:hypothetical protein
MIVSLRELLRRIVRDLDMIFSRDGILTVIFTKIARRGIRSQAAGVLINTVLSLTKPSDFLLLSSSGNPEAEKQVF